MSQANGNVRRGNELDGVYYIFSKYLFTIVRSSILRNCITSDDKPDVVYFLCGMSDRIHSGSVCGPRSTVITMEKHQTCSKFFRFILYASCFRLCSWILKLAIVLGHKDGIKKHTERMRKSLCIFEAFPFAGAHDHTSSCILLYVIICRCCRRFGQVRFKYVNRFSLAIAMYTARGWSHRGVL